jgi:hypothetical protein
MASHPIGNNPVNQVNQSSLCCLDCLQFLVRAAWLDWIAILQSSQAIRSSKIDCWQLCLSIRGLDDSWAATQLQDLIKKEQKDKDFPPITDLIAEFWSYYRRTRPIASGLGTFATLEVAGSSKSQEAVQGAQTGGKRQLGSPTPPGL